MLPFVQNLAQRVSGKIGRESHIIRLLRPMYESFLDVYSADKGVPRSINGQLFRIDPYHRRGFPNIYDPQTAELFKNHLRPGDTCINVGANVGVQVLQFAFWSGPSGRVIAFEPNPAARKVLEKHIALNGFTERVQVEALAVGAAPGSATLHVYGADGMTRLNTPNPELAGRTTALAVPVVTLDDYCKQAALQPRALLIDIEGFEIHALYGARQLIQERGKDLLIVVEMHPLMWESAGVTRADAEGLFIDLHLTPVPLIGQQDPLAYYGHVLLRHD